jgi:peptidyl-prolyl cis-trans isomerase D
MRRAAHIQFATKAEAEALIARLGHVDHEQFARLAREQSSDPTTRAQGGELGYFDKDGKNELGRSANIPLPLTAAAYALAHVGEVTRKPVALAKGFSVLMLTGEMHAFSTPQADIDARVHELLIEQHQRDATTALLDELRAQQKPIVHAELIDSIVLPVPEPRGIPQGFPAAPPDPREPPKLLAPDRY